MMPPPPSPYGFGTGERVRAIEIKLRCFIIKKKISKLETHQSNIPFLFAVLVISNIQEIKRLRNQKNTLFNY
jgi:hypothetical protein